MIKKNSFFILSILWVTYHSIICTKGFCEYWIDEYNDGWYLIENLDVGDGYNEQTIFDGPFKEKEAINYLNELEIKSQNFKKKYGTIYNFLPILEKDDYGQLILVERIGFKRFTLYITSLLFLIGPIVIFYKLFYKRN
jgi:hypothetical protein